MSVTRQGYKTAQDVYLIGGEVKIADQAKPVEVTIAGADASGGSVNTNLASTTIMQPVDIQSHYSQTIQTHAAAVVPPSSWNGPTWIDTNGFNEIAVSLLNDSATTSSISIEWSNDGTTKHGTESVAPNGAFKERVGSATTKARYAKVSIWNGDTIAHTMSAWAYLKA
jgi:hypothetical protein